MARALSVDLRRRVVGAIAGGLSCRAAAERFGVSPSSAIRWRAQEQREGDVTPKRQGGDRHSHRIEAHAELILSALAAKRPHMVEPKKMFAAARLHVMQPRTGL